MRIVENSCEIVKEGGQNLPAGQAPPKRVGLLCLLSSDCDTVQSMADKARTFHLRAAEALSDQGFVVYRPVEPTRSPEEAVAHIRSLETKEVEVLVLYIADWSFSTTAAWAALLTNRIPMVLWTNARPDCAGLIGAAVTKGALDELGFDVPLLYGNFEDETTRIRLSILCRGTAAARRLRGMRYGLGGTRSLEMITATVDPTQWLQLFGIDISGFDELDVVERTSSVDSQKVTFHKKWLQKEFGKVAVDDIVIELSIQLYLALKEILVEKKFDFISVKCLPVMAKVMTSFCLSHALLGDNSDAEGAKERMVCACESDSNGALTMQMMKNVDDQAIGFSDVRWLDPDANVLRISNCGSQATDLAKSKKDVHWVKHGLQELPWKHGAMCPQCIGKPGRVTMARLSRIEGQYVMLIAGGESLELPREALKETYWEFSPHTFIRLDAPSERFIANLRSNHIHHMYGDWRRELIHLCRVLKIRPIPIDDLTCC